MNKRPFFLLFFVSCSTVQQATWGFKAVSTQEKLENQKTSQSDLGFLTSLKRKVAEARKVEKKN